MLFKRSATTDTDPTGSVTAGLVRECLQAEGYRARMLEPANGGSPVIQSSAGGLHFVVLRYDPEHDPGATGIQFKTTLRIEASEGLVVTANRWNNLKRLGRAYVDSDGDLCLDHFVNTAPGFSREQLNSCIEEWTQLLMLFLSFLREDFSSSGTVH